MAEGTEYCRIPCAVARLLGGDRMNVAYIGGSVTQAQGSGDTTERSWRALFQKYLYMEYHKKYLPHLGSIVAGIGACNSPVMSFMLGRNVLPNEPALAFVEFCINDSVMIDVELARKGVEGLVRQLRSVKGGCDVVLLRVGCSPRSRIGGEAGTVPCEIHRQVADYYDLPLIDLESYTKDVLARRGEEWDEVIKPAYAPDDLYHANEYGNRLYFECIREAFERQVELYRAGRMKAFPVALPPPLFSDELQNVKLIDPSRKGKRVQLQGQWELKPRELVPWSADNLLVGEPGAVMTVTFRGTAVMVWALSYNNGLKVQAVLDGREVAGPYLNFTTEFCMGHVLAHGMPDTEHVLELTVGQPQKRRNRLEHPTAQIAAIGIGGLG